MDHLSRNAALLAALIAAATSCSTTRTFGTQFEDERITREIEMRLAVDPDASAYDVDVKVFGGEVVLLGEVEDERARQQAARIAAAVPGVRGVEDDLEVLGVPRETPFDGDADFATTARINFMYAADAGVRGGDIDVETIDGVVYLTGIVRSEAEQHRAEIIASDIPGVDDVRNRLEVRPGRR